MVVDDVLKFGEKWLSPPIIEALVHKINLNSLNALQEKALNYLFRLYL